MKDKYIQFGFTKNHRYLDLLWKEIKDKAKEKAKEKDKNKTKTNMQSV